MNAAKMVRLAKERHPEDFCAAKGCLWRVRTRDGFRPCPKHHADSLSPETRALMNDLVEALRNDNDGSVA